GWAVLFAAPAGEGLAVSNGFNAGASEALPAIPVPGDTAGRLVPSARGPTGSVPGVIWVTGVREPSAATPDALALSASAVAGMTLAGAALGATTLGGRVLGVARSAGAGSTATADAGERWAAVCSSSTGVLPAAAGRASVPVRGAAGAAPGGGPGRR